MKKLRFCLCAIACVLMLISCAKPQDKIPPDRLIVGEWKGPDHTGQIASLVFREDGSAEMIQGDKVIIGSSTGVKVSWRLDASRTPMHLDLVIAGESGKTQSLPMVVRFISETKIQLRISDDREVRPKEFSDSDKVNQITLTKQ